MMLRAVFDCIVAGCGLLLLSPLLAAIAAVILCETGRPVLFRQKRIGLNGQPFQLLKFRSMRTDMNGTSITARFDARVTSVGRVLRKYKLDELPQLWNILRRDMGFVGPRPEIPLFVDLDDPAWQTVLSVRPGLTDLATLIYRNEEDLLAGASQPERYYRDVIVPAKLALAINYMKVQSWWLDIRVIFMTVYYSLFPSQFDPGKIRGAIFDERLRDALL